MNENSDEGTADRMSLPIDSPIDNPTDAISLRRIANSPRRGVGDTSLSKLGALADGVGISLWDAVGRAEEAGLATASLRSVQSWRSLMQSLMAEHRTRSWEHAEEVLDAMMHMPGNEPMARHFGVTLTPEAV